MNIKQFIKSKEWAWRFLLLDDNGKDVNSQARIALADLRSFCHGTKSTFSSDPLEMARMTGRKEVFERVMTFLNYETSKIYDLEEELIDND